MQLSLWGGEDGGPAPAPSITPCYDTAIYSVRHLYGEGLSYDRHLRINGAEQKIDDFPEFSRLAKRRTLNLRTLGRLPTASIRCPFCERRLQLREELHEDPLEDNPGWPELEAVQRLEFCHGCRYWRVNELQTEVSDVRAELLYVYTLTTLSSKLRSFEEKAPEGTLEEIAQWFRRHPTLYHTVSPSYLEKLVARIFSESGEYVEVLHVGRPDDGGVDVVLVEGESRSWLVQVKRREHPRSSEPVSTIRNLLGAMVLEGSRLGVVVSTADHFTFRARESAAHAASAGFRVELVDRRALDAMLARSLPAEPWQKTLSKLHENRQAWFHDYYGNSSN